MLINVAGQSKVRVRDGAGNEAVFSINRPHTGLYLPRMVWKDMYDFFARFGIAGAVQRAPMTRRNTSVITTRSCGR